MNLEDELEMVKINLRSVLISKGKDGICMLSLMKDYENLCMEDLEYKKFGSATLTSFLNDKMRDTCRVRPDLKNPGLLRIYAIEDADTSHIMKLQRATRRKASPPRRRRMAGMFPGGGMGPRSFSLPRPTTVSYNTNCNRWASGRGNMHQPGMTNGPSPSWNNINNNSSWNNRSSQLDNNNAAKWPRGQSPSYGSSTPYGQYGGGGVGKGRSVFLNGDGGAKRSQHTKPPRFCTGEEKSGAPRQSSYQPPSTIKVPPKQPTAKPSAAPKKGKNSTSVHLESPVKKTLPEAKSSWEVYGGYLLSILEKKKFGALCGDLEVEYEKMYRESLPENWIDILENKLIYVAKDYGNGMCLLKALPPEERETPQQERQQSRLENSDVKPKPAEPRFIPEKKETVQPVQNIQGTPKPVVEPTVRHVQPVQKTEGVKQPVQVDTEQDGFDVTDRVKPQVQTVPNHLLKRVKELEFSDSEDEENNTRWSENRLQKIISSSPLRRPHPPSDGFTTPSDYSPATMKPQSVRTKEVPSSPRQVSVDAGGNLKVTLRPKIYSFAELPPYTLKGEERGGAKPKTPAKINPPPGVVRNNSQGLQFSPNTSDVYRDEDEIFVSDPESSDDENSWITEPAYTPEQPVRLQWGCVCNRPNTLVFCPLCCYVEKNTRVKTKCEVHPRNQRDTDILVCPSCNSELITELQETKYY
eukprot:TRINITY_DN4648_c0_g1_i3.p1 TRINITY_DN4648_c0_g1~~TRINITY_DN4648_c0_g1_i3.p1  ORF type:complete len:694 (-),score=125.83 TRINITY_DN4648_c0_g1_i3:272-2353(-)